MIKYFNMILIRILYYAQTFCCSSNNRKLKNDLLTIIHVFFFLFFFFFFFLSVVESKHANHTLKIFKNILNYARSIPQLILDHHNFKLLKPLF